MAGVVHVMLGAAHQPRIICFKTRDGGAVLAGGGWGARSPDAASSEPTPARKKAARKKASVKHSIQTAQTRQRDPPSRARTGARAREDGEGSRRDESGLDERPLHHEVRTPQDTAPAPAGGQAQAPLPAASAAAQSARGTHGADRRQEDGGKTTQAWAESDYRRALEACLRGGAEAEAEAGADTRKSCRAGYRKQLLNNLGVLLVQKAVGSLSSVAPPASEPTSAAADDKEPLLEEAVALFKHALALKPAWAQARHNLAHAEQALERLRR